MTSVGRHVNINSNVNMGELEMSKSGRQSQVQIRILLALNRGPVSTVAELARRVQVSRPSAHRSLASLVQKSLVIRDGAGWNLTRSGRLAAASAQENLNVRVQELLTKTAREATGLSAAASLTGTLTTRPPYEYLQTLSAGKSDLKAATNITREALSQFSPFKDLVGSFTHHAERLGHLGGAADTFKLDAGGQVYASGPIDSFSVRAAEQTHLRGAADTFKLDAGGQVYASGPIDSFSVGAGEQTHLRGAADIFKLDARGQVYASGSIDSFSVRTGEQTGLSGPAEPFRLDAGGQVYLSGPTDPFKFDVGRQMHLGGAADPFKYDVGGQIHVSGAADAFNVQSGELRSDLGGRDIFSLSAPVLGSFAMGSLLQVQNRQNELLRSTLVSGATPPLALALGHSNRILGKAVEGLGSMIHESIARPMFSAALTQVQPLFGQLVDVTRTYRSYMDDQFAYLERDLKWPSAGRIAILPTEALATYVGCVTTFADAQTAIGGVDVEPSGLCDIQQDLDGLLLLVSPELCDMRRGAWDTYYSRGRDRLRQAAHSMRELIEQITFRLAPDSSFDEKALAGQPITRKMRLKNIARGSDSTAEYVNAAANLVNVHYDELAKVAHKNNKHEMSVRLMLEAAERVILLLLIEGRFQSGD